MIAADDEEIQAACSAHDVDSILTSKAHQSGTDRLAEAARLLALDPHTVVVNVQADEPLLPPAVMREVAQLLSTRADCEIATAAHPIVDAGEFFSPDVVKVVVDAGARALMFSRAPIPWSRDTFAATRAVLPADLPAWRHVGLYATAPRSYRAFPRCRDRRLKNTRNLSNCARCLKALALRFCSWSCAATGVDTPDDLQRVRAMIRD